MSTGPVIAWIDGGSRGNPGVAGYGVRIETGGGTLLQELTGAIGIATNNQAEYRGLLAALDWLERNGCRNPTIRSDSKLLVRQMTGHFRVRHPGLKPLHAAAAAIARRLGRVRFEHVPRAANVEADRLANAAMDSAAVLGGTARAPEAPADAVGEALGATAGQAPLDTVGSALGKVLGAAAGQAADIGGSSAIIGIGIDIESIARVGRLIERYGSRFVERIFTAEESAYSMRRARPAQHFAARFAAKEAAMKALGTGHAQGVLWRGVEVIRAAGPPGLRLHGAAARRFEALGASRALLSISHSGDLALAQVLLVGR